MDDLTSKISEILSDPGALEQIKGLAGMFAQSPTVAAQPEKETSPPPSNDIMSSFDQSDMLQMAMKIMPLMNAYKRDDNTTRLLQALKPFLSEERQKKVDEALKILQIMRLMPLLKSALPGMDFLG